MRLLLVEDEADMAVALERALGKRGYVVDGVATLADAREALACASYSAVLLDRQLPDGDGIALLPQIRALADAPPVIVLTARAGAGQTVMGLDAGADDYLAKPFDLDELLARLRAVLRRTVGPEPELVAVGALRYDIAHREASVGELSIALPRRELAILDLLMRRCGRVVAREAIEAAVFGLDDPPSSNTIDSHISRLRRRLGDAGAGITIHASRGIGYFIRGT